MRDMEDSSDSDIDGMTYEDLLNLPTVEKGVDDKNVFPTSTYSKADTANPSYVFFTFSSPSLSLTFSFPPPPSLLSFFFSQLFGMP